MFKLHTYPLSKTSTAIIHSTEQCQFSKKHNSHDSTPVDMLLIVTILYHANIKKSLYFPKECIKMFSLILRTGITSLVSINWFVFITVCVHHALYPKTFSNMKLV